MLPSCRASPSFVKCQELTLLTLRVDPIDFDYADDVTAIYARKPE